MQYRVYDRQTLSYKDGGAVRDYSIDGDYINDNNSVISIVVSTTANVGDIVCLIENSGAYDKGVITAVDNETLSISYKHDKELFNDNILNPFASQFVDDTDIKAVGKFGLSVVGELIDVYFGRTLDTFKRLPLEITYSGDVLDDDGQPRMIWTWSNTQIKFGEWLGELFEKYSVVLSWDINFDTAQTDVLLRKPHYVIQLSAIVNDTDMIKDNVDTQTIKYQTEQQPEVTVCVVVDKNTKDIMYVSSGKNIFDATYGYVDSYLDENGKAYDVKKIAATQPQNSIVSSYIKVNPNITYTLSMEYGDEIYRNICFYNSSKTCIGIVTTIDEHNVEHNGYKGTTERFGLPFTTPANTRFVRVCFAGTAKNIQLEVGSTATAYDPFNKRAIFYLAYINAPKVTSKQFAAAGATLYQNTSFSQPIGKLKEPVGVRANNNYYTADENTSFIINGKVTEYSTSRTIRLHGKPISAGNVAAYELQNGEWVSKARLYYKNTNTVTIIDLLPRTYKVVYTPQKGIFTPTIAYFKPEDVYNNGVFYTTMDASDPNRFMPVKTKYVEYDSESDTETTVTDTAVNELTPNTFNQAIEIEIPRDSKMFDFELANYGDVYSIITKNGIIRSVYSGRKESSTNKMITLLFGLGRKNYTDLIQKGFRQQKYQTLYR